VGTVTSAMYQPDWDSFWAAAEETGIIVAYHVGGVNPTGGGGLPEEEKPVPGKRRAAFGMGLGDGATSFYSPFVGLFSFGVLERHPKLKVCLGESGIGWIPYVVQEMDYRFKQAQERFGADGVSLKTLPSEMFRRQVWATYQQDLVGLHLVDFFGDGHIMWASDYPHPDSTWPRSQEVIERETAHLSPEVKRKVLRENAQALYRI